jgi:hypothetical protein
MVALASTIADPDRQIVEFVRENPHMPQGVVAWAFKAPSRVRELVEKKVFVHDERHLLVVNEPLLGGT